MRFGIGVYWYAYANWAKWAGIENELSFIQVPSNFWLCHSVLYGNIIINYGVINDAKGIDSLLASHIVSYSWFWY